jgi:hypothetical protein
MAVNIEELRETTITAVLEMMTAQYENADVDAMRDFAAIVAQAAVSAVEHIVAQAQTAVSGESLK